MQAITGSKKAARHETRRHPQLSSPVAADLAIVIEVFEFTGPIKEIPPRPDEMIDGGLVTVEEGRVILYSSKK